MAFAISQSDPAAGASAPTARSRTAVAFGPYEAPKVETALPLPWPSFRKTTTTQKKTSGGETEGLVS